MEYDGDLTGASRGAGGARFRVEHGLLYAFVKVLPGDALSRDLQGRFTSFQHILYERNQKLAQELQDLALEKLDQSIIRPLVSTHRLHNALADPRNRIVTQWGFGVGVIDWLDRSKAKYWRAIEVGTSQFVGNPLPKGWLWGASLTGNYGGSSSYGPYPLAAGPFTVTGKGEGGRVRPMGPSYAYRILLDQGVERRKAYFMTRRGQDREIHTPIEAHHFLHDAWEEFDPVGRATAAIIAALKDAGYTGAEARQMLSR